MTTLRHLTTAVARLPGTAKVQGEGGPHFTVAGEVFADLSDASLRLRMDPTEILGHLADLPSAVRVTYDDGAVGVAVPLDDVNGMQANALLGAAWYYIAPASVHPTPAPASCPDLPLSIGRPAIRALEHAGLHTLAQVSTFSEGELLQLHGVGPRAVRLLAEALKSGGLTFS